MVDLADVSSLTKAKATEGSNEADRKEGAEFDAILEQAAPKIAEMARQAREMRRAGQTRKFPV